MASIGGTGTRWFPQFLPLTAMEDPSGPAPEEGVEVEEDLVLDDRTLPLAFHCPHHLEEISGASDPEAQSWRFRERMKTVSVALVVCLNVGVDPPDVIKTQPCARVECWIDPNTLNPPRALDMIGSALQKQYERWQSRARYRQSLDPTVDEVRRLTTGLRRNARDERVLFHYNGHGVPKPTANGEIWVFNRSYTQYIPLSLYDLQTWMGSPSIFVYDCSNAGIVVSCFEQFAEQHERDYAQGGKTTQDATPPPPPQPNPAPSSTATPTSANSNAPTPSSFKSCIQLAACSAAQLLPMNPELPADLFTACLTTPIKMALRWFVMQSHGKLASPKAVTLDMLDKIPGQVSDRRTMLGELNWIFTAITDTIAWNTIPRGLFQRLFRQDLLVASLFRNFLLAERVMRSYDCTPISRPAMPPTHQHPMWQAWDLAVDISLAQLPSILEGNCPYKPSSFFEEQLTAFEMWLKYGDESRPPPEQLPIVLQVLLSQAHRLRALDLLGRFLDLGPWAVNLALSVGIFPYVLRLLQSSARELRPLLVSIWAKILAVDASYQADLVRESSHRYFLSVLQDDCMMPSHRTWAAFILASIVHNFRQGQKEADAGNLICIALDHLDDPEPLLRQWLAVAMGRVWDGHEAARWRGARNNAHERLYELLKDPVPQVRAAAVFALGTFVNSCEKRTEHANSLDHSIALHLFNTVSEDASPLVRQELVLALQHVVAAFETSFVAVCRHEAEESVFAHLQMQQQQQLPASRSSGSLSASSSSSSVGGTYTKLWHGLVLMEGDPNPDVAGMARTVAAGVRKKLRASTGSSVPSSPKRCFAKKEDVDAVDLATEFLPWSAKYFSKQLMRHECLDCDCDHESGRHWRKEWLYNRNHAVRLEAEDHQELVRKRTFKVDRACGGPGAPRMPGTPADVLAFHPYNSKIVAAGGSHIAMWDLDTGEMLSSPVLNVHRRVTSLDYVNAHEDALLLVACDDGTLRLFKDDDEDSATTHRLVSAWNGLRELAGFNPRIKPSGLPVRTAWSQFHSTLGVGGDARHIRLWDARTELKKCDLDTANDSHVSSLTFSSYYAAAPTSGTFAAGFGDGAVKLFDVRAKRSAVAAFKDLAGPVLECRFQESPGQRQVVVAASADGEVAVVEPRKPPSALASVSMNHPVSRAAVHQRAPLMAAWNPNHQTVSVVLLRKGWDDGGQLSVSSLPVNAVKSHDEGVLGTRLGPDGGLAFHPQLVQLAVGSRDGAISIKSIRKAI